MQTSTRGRPRTFLLLFGIATAATMLILTSCGQDRGEEERPDGNPRSTTEPGNNDIADDDGGPARADANATPPAMDDGGANNDGAPTSAQDSGPVNDGSAATPSEQPGEPEESPATKLPTKGVDAGRSAARPAPDPTVPTPPAPVDAGTARPEPGDSRPEQTSNDSPDADNTPTSRLTALLQAAYSDVRTFEADFAQTYRNRLLDRTRESTGHVWLRPPSKMRWEYAPPSKNLIVADGRMLFVFEPEPNQVIRIPVAGSELPSVMAFLTGGENITRDYHVQEVHHEKLAPRGQAGLELRPRSPSSVVSRVVLVISSSTGRVNRTVLVEPEGNTNTFVWSKVRTSVSISESRFVFTPPAGARIVER